MEKVIEFNKNEFCFVLEDFEGPLDLLLELIKAKNLNINEVRISMITDQYLELVKNIDILDFDKASEFITMAATLLEIKSKSVLPKPEEEVVEIEDEEQLLLRRLEEYKIFKEKAEEIKKNETINRFYAEPAYTDEDARISIINFDMDKLISAYASLLLRFTNKASTAEPRKILKARYSVADRIQYVAKLLKVKTKVNFSDLFEDDSTKGEIINTFLALLELLKRQIVSAVQDNWGGDIVIAYNEIDEEFLLKQLESQSLEEENA